MIEELKAIRKDLKSALDANDKILIGYGINRLDTLLHNMAKHGKLINEEPCHLDNVIPNGKKFKNGKLCKRVIIDGKEYKSLKQGCYVESIDYNSAKSMHNMKGWKFKIVSNPVKKEIIFPDEEHLYS